MKKIRYCRCVALMVSVLILVCGCSAEEKEPVLNDSVRACTDTAIVMTGDLADVSWYELTAVAPTTEISTEYEACLISWSKAPGDEVREGETIAVLEYGSGPALANGTDSIGTHSEDEYARLDVEIERAKLEAVKEAGEDSAIVRLQEIDTQLAELKCERLLAATGSELQQPENADDLQESSTASTSGEHREGQFVLTSPADGIITYRSSLMPGDKVSALSCLATVTGQQVELKGEFISERALNSIERIYAFINGKECDLEKLEYSASDYTDKTARFTSSELPEPGSDVGAFIVRNTVCNAVYVPADALRADRDGYFLYELDEAGNRIRHDVEIGVLCNGYVQLVSGIEPGKRVIVSDTARSADGAAGVEAHYGTFYDELKFKATVSCLESAKLYFKEDNAVFGGFLVEEGDFVKAGTVIAVCKTEITSDEIPSLEHEIARLEQNLEQRTAAHQSETEILEAKASGASGSEKTVYELKKQLANMKYDDYAVELRSEIERLRNEIAICGGERQSAAVIAPIDGYIDKLAYISEGDKVSSSRWIAMIHSDKSEYLQVTDKKTELNGLMKVRVQANGKEYYSGTVVQADNLLEGEQRTGKAYVLLDDRSIRLSELSDPVVIAQKPVVENVLMIPRSAVFTAKGKKYVTVTKDGVAQKRYITVGPNNNEDICVLGGLNEGDSVLVQ